MCGNVGKITGMLVFLRHLDVSRTGDAGGWISSELAIERERYIRESARLVGGSYIDDNLGSVERLPKLTEQTGVVE